MPYDRIGRRSRFKRTRTGKNIILSDRDVEILTWLHRYRYLRSPQLIGFVQPVSEKRFLERLGDLFHETGLIARPKAQWRSFDARYTPMIYELSRKGRCLLEDRGEVPDCATSLTRTGRQGAAIQFEHAMMIVDALVSVELATRAHSDQRFVPVDEILRRAPEKNEIRGKALSIPITLRPGKHLPTLKAPLFTHIVPDGLYGIEYLVDGVKRYRFWALECENQSPQRRKNIGLSSLATKKAAYEELIRCQKYRDVWGIPNLKLHLCTRA